MPESDEVDDCNDFESNIGILPAENGKHWFYKLQQFFQRKTSLSDSQQSTNSVFERSSSSVSRRVEERMCKELRYFFMNPCEKYKAKKRKPFKLGIQILKIVLVTLQLVIFGGNNQELVGFMNDSYDVFYNVFLNRTTNAYTKAEVYNQINFVRNQYSIFENITVGNFGYSKTLNNYCSGRLKAGNDTTKKQHSLLMCVDEYLFFDADLDHDHLVYNTSGSKRECHCLQPWTKNGREALIKNTSFPLINGSLYHINFHRLIKLTLSCGIRTVRIMSSHSYHQTDCYDINVTITLDNQAHSGKIDSVMDSQFVLAQCPHTNATENTLSSKPLVILSLILDAVIIFNCSLSLILCLRSLWRGQRLRRSFERFYWRRYSKKLDWFLKLEFFNFWYFLIIVSDILTIMGSITKIVTEIQLEGTVNSDLCSVFLGVGCLCVWIGVLRYAGFFHQYNILVLTLKKSLPHVLRFMVCASVLYLGFLFCGWVVLGPYHHKFRNLIVTSEAMFSLINGDDMYMTYEEMSKKSSLAWGFSQAYLYIFISLFIYIVLSLFIAVIMETYETIKDWQKANFPPQNEIQTYLSQHSDPNQQDVQYDYNSDTYCCCCLYHNSDPDIEYQSSDEEIIET